MVGGYSLVPKTPQVGPGPRGSLPFHSFLLVCLGPRRECFLVQAPEDVLGANVGSGDFPSFFGTEGGVFGRLALAQQYGTLSSTLQPPAIKFSNILGGRRWQAVVKCYNKI